MKLSPDTLRNALDQAVPDAVRHISKVLADAGFRSWIVGGCVRDVALGLLHPTATRAGDWDMCTDATPEQVQGLFRRVIPTGLEHGTVTVVLERQHYEVTTLRGEKGHSDGRRPDEVYFVNDLTEDLARRDFTVNAMAYDVIARDFADPFAGLADLENCSLRAVGEPARRFAEDGLRVLRCARFAATLDFEIEAATAAAIEPSLDSFRKVALERVRDEWFKALSSQHAERFLDAVRQHGMLAITLPELFTSEDNWSHAVQNVCQAFPAGSPYDPALLRLALLIALGKNPSLDIKQSAKLCNTLGARLRLSRQETAELTLWVTRSRPEPELLDTAEPAAVRRFLAQFEREQCEAICLMQQRCGASEEQDRLQKLHTTMREQISSRAPLYLKELALTGQDLLDLGVSKGPQLGVLLRAALELVLEHPEKNSKAELTEWVQTQIA